MSGALSVDDAEAPAFGPEDRVALGALSGGDPAALADAALAVIENEPLRPLAAAATAASAVTANLPIGDPEVRARVALGRRLATVKTLDELKDAVHAMRAASNESPLGRLLSLELDAAAGAHSAVAAELNRLAPSSDPSGALAAALIEEASGHDDVAHRHYVAALGAPDVAEAAARALLAPGDANAAQILSTLAGVLGEEGTPRQSLLLFEAAARTEPSDTAAVEELLAKAHDASPTLPFAPRMGADLALAAGDVPRLLEWLTRRQKTAKDPMLRALDAVREALLVADDDPKRAAERVAEALEVRPEDVALHELAERLDPTRTIERARVREQLSERATSPRARARLLFEAAIEYERQGARADAARAARAAGATGGSELAQAAAERYSVDAHAEAPSGLAKLRADEQAAMASPTDEGMLAVARALSTLTDPGEAAAHARLAARLQELAEPSDAPLEARPKLAEGAEQSLWALRDDEAHARLAGDDEAVLRTTRELAKRSPRPFDAAVLSLRAAEAALRLGQKDEAIALVSRTLGVVKDHLVARALRAALTEESDPKTAANDLEALATDSSVTEHRFDAFYRAAVLRLDRTGETDLGREALEKAAEIDITQRDVFDRLQVLYVQKGDRQKLADLLEKRLAGTDDPELRISLEVTRGKALSDIGDRDAARRALNAALEANPDHADALEAFAGLAAADGDFEGAEQALIRLARTATEPERQAAIYRKLAKLYDGDLPNPSRAEICYREILKRLPDDADAMQSLVFVYVRLGDAVKALELATQLVDKAQANDEKRDRTLALSRVYDEAGKDKKSALSVLEKARKTWPHDRAVLRAVATFHERHGETAAQTVLLDRATAEARRALSHGRFELSFFGILETAAELRGNVDASTVASATLAALECRDDVAVRGAGAAAADVRLDDLLAPELLSAPLRALLKKLPGVLDAAYPLDTKALRTQPLPPSAADLAQEIRIVAESVGIRALELLVSPTLGPVFVAASTSPARLVMGQALLDSSDFEARYFSLFRTLKAMQAEASAFTRIAPIEQWPALAGLLSLVAPSFSPQGVDAAKLADARRKLSAVLPAKIDADVETLALEVASAVGNRGSQLGQATGQWGSRTALLAVGSPRVALRGVALSLGQPGGPPEGAAERVKWVLRHPEARDLTVFSVSDNHAEARKRVGLTE
jgi:tetratricopeptide (TPR) repeat protein